jgi:hypothetical protein
MKFHVVYSYNNSLPNTTPPVEKEAVAMGMYYQLSHDLNNGIQSGSIDRGYVRLYGAGKVMREYTAEQVVYIQQPEERSAQLPYPADADANGEDCAVV